jgi:serine/threonine protein kinase
VLRPGEEFEGFVVDSTLGRGGSAVVYRAHAADGVPVALKVLDSPQPAQRRRLQREFDFARRISDPHVVSVYRAGPDWLAMEYVDGGTVSRLTTLADRLTALAQVAAALDHAHQLGIVHCDVKPTNILVHKPFSAGGAVLIDFGVAHSLAETVGHHPAHIEASLPYAAPELLHGQPPSPAVDEYALACTTVELITGAPPFTANTSMALVDAHLNRQPPKVSRSVDWVPHAFDSILAKAMAKSPESRYVSCVEFIGLVTRALR